MGYKRNIAPHLFRVKEVDVKPSQCNLTFRAVPEAHEEGCYGRFSSTAWSDKSDVLSDWKRKRDAVKCFRKASGVSEAEAFNHDLMVSWKGQRTNRCFGLRLGIEDFKKAFTGVLVRFQVFDCGRQGKKWFKRCYNGKCYDSQKARRP